MLIRLLRAHLGPYKRPILVVVVLQTVATIALLYLPTLNADLIDHGVLTGDTGYILRAGAVMLGISVVQVLAAGAAVLFAARIAMGLGRDVRAALFDSVQSFSTREVGRFGTPSLVVRTTNDVQQVQILALTGLLTTVPAPVTCLGAVLLAVQQDALLSVPLVGIVPTLGVIITLVVRRLHPLARTMQQRLDAVNRILREQIGGLRVIRAFVRDEGEKRRFGAANAELTDVALRYGRAMALLSPAVLTVMAVTAVVVLWLGVHRVAADQIQIGALSAFLSYTLLITLSLMTATFMFMVIPRAEVCAERIQEVMKTSSTLPPPANPVRFLPRYAELELRDVGFGYPGAEAPVLRGVNLRAGPGQTIAVIGSTGSGKTTLLGLVPRLADVTGGTVLVDGVDVRDLDPGLLAATVGLVPQKPYLFSGTVATNLRYGDPDATDTELWRALEVAQAKEFVEAMSEGLDTPVAQGGTNVSGGQRQRLAIARVLVRRPEIYLFDDAFSALDQATDAKLRAALAWETAAATVVIAAQRVATVWDADQIVVLDHGEVVGIGTHQDLMARSTIYREIVHSQLSEEDAA